MRRDGERVDIEESRTSSSRPYAFASSYTVRARIGKRDEIPSYVRLVYMSALKKTMR